MATPDIRLVVGVDTGLSYSSMRDGISEIIQRIEKENPPKIKIQFDDAELNKKIQSIRSQITEISNQKVSIGATGELQSTLTTISSSLETLSQKIAGIGDSANFNNLADSLKSITPVIENLKLELASLRSATQSFQGINLNIGLGGGNAVTRNAQYGKSARQTVSELKEQARALEEVFKQYTRISDGFPAVMKALQGTNVLQGKDIFQMANNMGDPKLALSKQMDAWKEYIALMQEVARVKGIDITPVTSSFTKGANELVESTQKILTGESELESGAEKLKSIFGSGINSEALNAQLTTINDSINRVSSSIANLKLDGNSLNSFVESVNKLSGSIENLILTIDSVTNRNTSMSDGITSVARAAQKASASLGEYTVKLDESNRKILSDNLSLEHSKIDDFVRRLADLKISAQAVKARWEEITEAGQRLTRVIIDGANAQNDAVKHTIEFDKKTGEISKEYTEVVHKAKAVKEEIRGAGDASAKSKNETKETKANLEAIDGLIKSIEKTNSSLNSSKNKVTDALGGLSSTGQNKAELEEINKKFDELMVATERLKTNRMTANQEDVDGLRKIQEELDALIRKSQERLRIEAESKDLSSATSAEKNVSRIKEMLNTKDIDASVAKVTDRFEKLGDSGAKGLGKVKTGIVQINTLLASLKSSQVLSNDNALLSTYQRLSTLLETVSNKISIIESRTNTAKKINFGRDTEKFKTDIDVLQQKLNKLTNKRAPLYSIITKNMTKLQAAFQQMNNSASTQAQRVTAYERLNKLIPVVTKQIRIQTAEETAAANAAKKAKAEAVRGAKQQILANEQANVQRRIAYQLIAQIAQAQKEWTKARNGSMSNEYAKLQSYSSQLTTLLNQLSSGTIGKSDFSAQVKNIGNEFVRTSSIIRTAGEDTKTLADRFGSLGSKFSIWFSTTRIIMMVYANIRKMISASIELDKTMTQLQIVTKQNDDAMTKFGDSAAAAAKRIGSSITDFVSSATTYARLGYSLDESSQLAEFTAMLQNVGDIDVSEAQDAITSIVKAFNIGTDQIESVMDKMVIAGNNFPISVSQIAEGMKNASSALAAAGNSFDQSVALLTAANTTIQDAAKSSTGLRTITARIRKTKTELDDLGETISEADYEKLVKSLTDMNVALTENGEYRSTYDILRDIAAQWKNLTSMEQAAMAEALAGNRQQTVLMSIISNFQEASGAMEAMANSSGELRESYATYMESAEAHINQLKAAFESLAQSIFNSDSIKSVVDMLAGLLTTLDNIVKTIGGVPTIITGIAAALPAFKNVGILDLFKAVDNYKSAFNSNATFSFSKEFLNSISQDETCLKDLEKAISGNVSKTDALAETMGKASVAARKYAEENKITESSIQDFIMQQRQSQVTLTASGNSLRSHASVINTYNHNLSQLKMSEKEFCDAVRESNPYLGNYLSTVKAGDASIKGYASSLIRTKIATIGLQAVTTLLNAALTGLISLGVSAVINVVSEQINAVNKRMNETNSSISELRENTKALDDYKEKAKGLREELDKGGLTLSEVTDKRKELYDIQEILIDKYGKEAEGIDLVTGSIEEQIAAIDELNAKKTGVWLNDHRTSIKEANEYLNNDFWDAAKNYTEVQPFKEGYRTWGGKSNVTEWLKDWITNNFSESEVKMQLSKGNSDDSGVPNFYFYGSRRDIAANYDKLYSAVQDYLETEKDLSDDDKKNVNALLNAISGAKQWLVNDDYKKHEENYKEATKYVAQTESAYKKFYDEISKYQKEYDDAVVQGNDDAAKKSYAKVQSAYKNLFENGDFSQTLNNIRGEDVKQWFKDQQKDFADLSVPIRLKIDIEGTKREFDSTKSELIKMYTAVGDNGFSIAYDKGVPYLLDENNISVNQAEEFNAICDAAKKAGVSLESYIEALVQYGKVVDDTVDKNATASLTTMFNGYTEEVKQAQDAISPLLDAYNKLQKGELSNSDIVTLISDKFPSLIQYTDNLSVGIQKLAKDKLAELKEKLDAVDRSKLSEDDLKAYDKFIEYIDSLNDGFSSTIAYYEKIQSKTKSVSDSIITLISLSKEITENESLSMSSVDKIMSDDTLTSLRPYLNDVKTMLPIINKLIEDQKQAYEDLYNEQQRLADPDAYLKAVQEKEKADKDALQDSIKRIDEQVKKFKEKYDVDLSNWDKLGDDKKQLLQNTNAELISKQITLINKYNELYGIDLRNFKNVAAAKEAIIEKINTDFVRSNTFQQISQYLNEHNLLSMHNGILSFGGNVQDWEPVQVMLDRAKLSLSDLRLYLQNGIMPEDKSKSLQEYLKENLEKEFKDVDLAQLNADLNSFINPFTIKDDTWEKLTESIGAGSSSSSKAKTWFEQQYAYHNHLVNMDQEKQQDYLDWLDSAYKQAYNQGIIDLDAYYKYEEEVYNGRKKLAGDTSNWFEKQYKEHQHLLKMEKEDETTYLKWLDSAYKKAYAEGLITLDDYRKYQEEVYDGIKKLKDNAESAIKELINIRINMLKEDINKEKEAINTRLKNLKEFYDKQKEMLQDKYDQEKYLEEQSEKRKSVSDIQEKIEQLRFDDSASAQKKRIELQKDLLDAQKELTDFEKEHSYNQTKDQLDKLYEQQEKDANKQIEALEKRANNPKELYEQALNDIRNGSQALYGQMIEWNYFATSLADSRLMKVA